MLLRKLDSKEENVDSEMASLFKDFEGGKANLSAVRRSVKNSAITNKAEYYYLFGALCNRRLQELMKEGSEVKSADQSMLHHQVIRFAYHTAYFYFEAYRLGYVQKDVDLLHLIRSLFKENNYPNQFKATISNSSARFSTAVFEDYKLIRISEEHLKTAFALSPYLASSTREIMDYEKNKACIFEWEMLFAQGIDDEDIAKFAATLLKYFLSTKDTQYLAIALTYEADLYLRSKNSYQIKQIESYAREHKDPALEQAAIQARTSTSKTKLNEIKETKQKNYNTYLSEIAALHHKSICLSVERAKCRSFLREELDKAYYQSDEDKIFVINQKISECYFRDAVDISLFSKEKGIRLFDVSARLLTRCIDAALCCGNYSLVIQTLQNVLNLTAETKKVDVKDKANEQKELGVIVQELVKTTYDRLNDEWKDNPPALYEMETLLALHAKLVIELCCPEEHLFIGRIKTTSSEPLKRALAWVKGEIDRVANFHTEKESEVAGSLGKALAALTVANKIIPGTEGEKPKNNPYLMKYIIDEFFQNLLAVISYAIKNSNDWLLTICEDQLNENANLKELIIDLPKIQKQLVMNQITSIQNEIAAVKIAESVKISESYLAVKTFGDVTKEAEENIRGVQERLEKKKTPQERIESFKKSVPEDKQEALNFWLKNIVVCKQEVPLHSECLKLVIENALSALTKALSVATSEMKAEYYAWLKGNNLDGPFALPSEMNEKDKQYLLVKVVPLKGFLAKYASPGSVVAVGTFAQPGAGIGATGASALLPGAEMAEGASAALAGSGAGTAGVSTEVKQEGFFPRL